MVKEDDVRHNHDRVLFVCMCGKFVVISEDGDQ